VGNIKYSFEGDLAEIILAFGSVLEGALTQGFQMEESQRAHQRFMQDHKDRKVDDEVEDLLEEALSDDGDPGDIYDEEDGEGEEEEEYEDAEDEDEDEDEDEEEEGEFVPSNIPAPSQVRHPPRDPQDAIESSIPPLAAPFDPTPQPNYSQAAHSQLGAVSPDDSIIEAIRSSNLPLKPEAWTSWVEFIEAWCDGFESPLFKSGKRKGQPRQAQPDRVQLMKDVGQGHLTAYVVRYIIECGSLQTAVLHALAESSDSRVAGGTDFEEEEVDFAVRVSHSLVQVSHVGFPDLTELFDHSTRWRRNL